MQDRVVVTGAASGLGLVIAQTLLSHGWPVVLVDRDQGVHARGQELSADFATEVPVLIADLSSINGAHTAADLLVDQFHVGGLVNNAGGWLPGDQYPEASSDRWLSAVMLNLIAPMLLVQRLWPSLSKTSPGAVVNVGSSGGEGDDPYESPEYGAAKAGLRRFTASMGSRTGVRVMGVIPGWIGLDRAKREWAALTPEQQHQVGPLIPPEDVANIVVRLLADGRAGEVVEILRGLW